MSKIEKIIILHFFCLFKLFSSHKYRGKTINKTKQMIRCFKQNEIFGLCGLCGMETVFRPLILGLWKLQNLFLTNTLGNWPLQQKYPLKNLISSPKIFQSLPSPGTSWGFMELFNPLKVKNLKIPIYYKSLLFNIIINKYEKRTNEIKRKYKPLICNIESAITFPVLKK